jgi:tetratricopeptide (TPR) repeat protein
MMAVTLDSLRKAVKKNKGRSQAMAWLADLERASGDYEAALKVVDAALAASPNDVPAMLVRAKILAGQQDFAGSISEYKKVLAKDPFCLSAHKRMGESYDKLGKTAERNACFRRVHDMDPLDPFWKDEYDVLPEEEQTLAPPPMDDSSFTMDVSDDSENNEASGEDNIFANLAASLPNTDEEDNASMDALRNSLNFASDDIAKNPDGSEIPDFDGHVLNSSEVSSAISGILGGDDDLDVVDSEEKEEPATSSFFSHFSDESEPVAAEEPKSEDVPEELADEPLSEVSDEKSEDAEFSLDSLDEPLDADEKATNVDDAFSSLLGDDELPEEAQAEPSTDSVSEAELPVGSEKPVEVSEESLGAPDEEPTDAENLVGHLSESGVPSMHMDFSDDEVSTESDELSLDESPKEEAETNVDDAFSSLLGDDELPEENAPASTEAEPATENVAEAEESADNSFGSLFEKSADADFSLNDEVPVEAENVPAELADSKEPAEEESFGSLFEKSAEADFSLSDEPAAENALEKAPEFVPTESAENVAPAEGLVPTSHMDFSDEEDLPKSDDEFVLNLDEDAPATENESAPETVAEDAVDAKAEDESAAEEVDGAFDALFGDDEVPADDSASSATENVEEIVEEAPVTEEPVAETPVAEAPVAEQPKEEDLAKEMGGAFASMFGDDDLALPEEKSNDVEEQLSQEATSAEIEEESVKEDVEKSVDESFDSIFGVDADDLPEEKSEVAEAPVDALASSATENVDEIAETPVEEPTSVFSAPAEAFEEPVEEPAEQVAENAPSAELDSIDSEVSNAFKGLFDEDDSLPESDEPNNNGVDYLMSGDSDDEVAASLVENADAPLSRGAADLDDSLNTRTLADIYMEQGVYDKALDIYTDLAKKNPDNEEIKSRLEEVKKLCRDKFGEV